MAEWFSSGWTITTSHILVETPPPAPTRETLFEWDPMMETPEEGFGLTQDAYDELTEDLATAQEALANYENRGTEGTIPYNEYRMKRLES